MAPSQTRLASQYTNTSARNMVNFTVAFAVFMLCAFGMTEAAVYIGGGCYDCKGIECK